MMQLIAVLIPLSLIGLLFWGAISGIRALSKIRRLSDRIQNLEGIIKQLSKTLFDLQKSVQDPRRAETTAREKPPVDVSPSAAPERITAAIEPQSVAESKERQIYRELPRESIPHPVVPPPVRSEQAESAQESPKRDFSPARSVSTAAAPSEEKGMDLETRIGAVWFNRIGLVGLIVGFALLGRMFDYQPWHKTAGSYAASAALLFAGWFYEERLKRWSHPVMAAGLALAFFTSYAAYFIPAMRCVPLGASLILMTLSVASIFFYAERWQSQSTAGLAIFLGHVAAYTSGGSSDTFSLAAILFLCLTSLLLFMRHNWVPLSLFSVCAAYISHVLWALQDHTPSTPEFSFWLNFGFLSSYYAIFLCADLIHHHRRWSGESASLSRKQLQTGRLVGPASLIFYATVVSGLFFSTKIYWDSIYLYYIPLFLVQTVLLLYHRSRRNPDYSFYAVAGATFLTLGLFSCMDGLSLNMTLAAEALILLILSRRLQLWYLNPLAQAVLIANFIHFWLSDASEFETWPSYLGCVLTAAVYFVKSRLEETWPTAPDDSMQWESRWAQRFAGWIFRAMPGFAYIHALGGASLAIYQSVHFFDPLWEETGIVLLAAGVTLGAIRTLSRAWIPAVWLMLCAVIPLSLARRNLDFVLPNWPVDSYLWGTLLDQSFIIPSIAGAYAALHFARRWRRPLLAILAMGILPLCGYMVLSCAHPRDPHCVYYPVWLIAPLSFWAIGACIKRFKSISDWNWSGSSWEILERRVVQSISPIAWIVTAAGAILTWQVCRIVVVEDCFLLLSLLGLAIASIAAIGKIAVFASGLTVLLLILLNHFCVFLNANGLPESAWIVWWLPASAVLISGLFFVPLFFKRKTAFAASAIAAILIILESLAVLSVCSLTNFPAYPVWLAILAAIWAQEEWLSTFFSRNPNENSELRESFWLEFTRQNIRFLCYWISFVAAFLLFLITYRHMETSSATVWLAMLYSALLSAAAWLRRSPPLASGIPLLLFASHVVYYADIHPGAGAATYPYVTEALCVFTFLAAGSVEWLLYNRPNRLTPLQHSFFMSGSFCFYGLAFILGSIFLDLRGSMIWDHSSYTFAFQTAFPLIVLLAAWRAKLGLLYLAAFIDLFLLDPRILAESASHPGYQADLLYGGALVFIQIVAMERILSFTKTETVTCLKQTMLRWMRRLLVVTASALMLYFITNSGDVQNYWTTFGWSLLGFFIIVLGFVWKDKTYRRTALAVFLLCIMRIILIDVANLEAFYRMVAFLCLGACLIAVSFLYSRFSREIQKWL